MNVSRFLFDETGNTDKHDLFGFYFSDDGRVELAVMNWIGERHCVIVDGVVVVESFLDLLFEVGGVVFCFNVSVELLQTAGDVCFIVASGRMLALGNVLLALSKSGVSCHLL